MHNILNTFAIFNFQYYNISLRLIMSMSAQLDTDGHLMDYTQWNEEVAQQLAISLHIELTAWHLQILYAMRKFYQQYSHAPATRPLIKYLQQHVDQSINNQILQQQFNTGLVARHIARLAGIPKPANCL